MEDTRNTNDAKLMREIIEIFKDKVNKLYEEEKTDFNVINNVEVKINSSDDFDLKLGDNEKDLISKLIDDFHTEVSEIVDFDDFIIYEDSTKLTGTIPSINLRFVFSNGDDEGLFLTNISSLKITDENSKIIEKLMNFQSKYIDVSNKLIRNRKEN